MSLSGEEQELRCVLNWFTNWEEQQRDQFLNVLIEKAVPPDIDQLFQGLDQLTLNSSFQSVFQCQLRLFSQWFDAWTCVHRNKLLYNLHLKDPSFVEKFHYFVNLKNQVNFLGQWFISWSEMQREDFLPILVQAYQPKDHINGLLGGIDSISLQGRRPSLFDCQVKLFHDWFVSWTEGERERLLQHLREVDPDFMAQFDKQISGIESPQEEAAIQSECTEESLNNPSSSVSSPPSTLPRSHSPHDSGLDEPPSDGDHTGPHSLDSSHDTDDVAAAVVVGGNVSTGDITELPLAKTAVPHIPNNNEVEEDKSAKVEPQENGTPDEKIVPASEGMENSLPAED